MRRNAVGWEDLEGKTIGGGFIVNGKIHFPDGSAYNIVTHTYRDGNVELGYNKGRGTREDPLVWVVLKRNGVLVTGTLTDTLPKPDGGGSVVDSITRKSTTTTTNTQNNDTKTQFSTKNILIAIGIAVILAFLISKR